VKRSTARILTTHTGSLPRPEDLIRMMFAKEEGVPVDPGALAARIRAAVAEVASKQVQAGVDVVNDGEMSKPSYATYVKDRLHGFGGASHPLQYQDLVDFPGMAKRVFGDPGRARRRTPACDGPISVRDPDAARADTDNLRAALQPLTVTEGFMSAASPGVVSLFFRNDHYPSHEAYLFAIADAMRHEYEAVARAGFILQIDCPDLAMGRHIQYAALGLDAFKKAARLHIDALNHALANVPPEQARIHLCWGNYEGPHHYDVALADILDVVFTARPAGISFEAANPRHAHEWKVFERIKLPDGKVIIPGVIDSTTNFIEHPELVAERITTYANLVGRENVIAGTDCGFGTWVGQAAVDPDIVWAKLGAMAEGARLATRSLWGAPGAPQAPHASGRT
jgi:5-methyltetrahydropteroyltriglutamate--homocysteine methyltransferase